jgi:hypothetical protein
MLTKPYFEVIVVCRISAARRGSLGGLGEGFRLGNDFLKARRAWNQRKCESLHEMLLQDFNVSKRILGSSASEMWQQDLFRRQVQGA